MSIFGFPIFFIFLFLEQLEAQEPVITLEKEPVVQEAPVARQIEVEAPLPTEPIVVEAPVEEPTSEPSVEQPEVFTMSNGATAQIDENGNLIILTAPTQETVDLEVKIETQIEDSRIAEKEQEIIDTQLFLVEKKRELVEIKAQYDQDIEDWENLPARNTSDRDRITELYEEDRQRIQDEIHWANLNINQLEFELEALIAS